MSGTPRRAFIVRWIFAVTVGETLGFAVAASVAVAVAAAGAALDPWAAYAIVVAGGAVEGALLGFAQQRAAGRAQLGPGWVLATSGGTAVAWSLGMLPSTLGADLPHPVGIAALVIGGVLLLASIPTAQWMALHRRRTARWIPVTMGAWAVAVLWTAAPSPIIDEHTPAPLVVVAYLCAGVLMAVTIAALTAATAASLFATTAASRRDFGPAPVPVAPVPSQP
ncbi:hypothetical protein [Leifsonia aquatica]|uniref:hypothetical protein n=1 Tax=Leifsonia aquatica TaxID=144185 RepID=UPI0028AA79BE|nr:hypothetical protein [Leifsonia aquatica]